MDTGLTQTINELIPKSLDDIIRRNRELVELRLATEADIHPLEKEIGNLHPVKDVIEDWRLICLSEKETNWVQMMLLGRSTENNCSWITSTVVAIDFKQKAVLTNSGSVYTLGKPGQGEPPMADLMHVCATLHKWGSGDFLGAPHFFY